MCGIIGMIVPSGLQETHLSYFTEMLKRCQARGTHATGAFNDAMDFVKAPIRAVDFVKTEQYKTWLAGNIGKIWIIGHTRLWSRGPPEINDNNHPVMLPGQEKKAMVIHNGAFNSPAYDKDRNKSDTHIPLWITENSNINSKDDMLTALSKIYTCSSGSYVFVFGAPDVLGFGRSYGKPLVFYTKGKNVAFASTDAILGRKSTHEMDVGQSMVYVKSTQKWSKIDMKPTPAIPTPQTSVEIGTDGRTIDPSAVTSLNTIVHPSEFVRYNPPAEMWKQRRASGSTTNVVGLVQLRERLDELTELDEFTCFSCGATLWWECVTEIREGRLFYKCPDNNCKNHVNPGWRSLKSLNIHYVSDRGNLTKEYKKKHKTKKDPRSWFEDRSNPCPGNFVPLDGFTNYGYCLVREIYVNSDEDCQQCGNRGENNGENKQHNESHA